MSVFKKIAIVIPVYREASGLITLYDRLEKVTASLPQFSWEYILVNDGSPDNSFEVLASLAARDPKIKALDLSRNFGKEIALTAGVHEATDCDAVICIDADLQHPPELIPNLIAAWEDGAEVVVTVRTSANREPLFRRWGSNLFYWLINKVSSFEMTPKATDFRLYDKKVVRAFERATERERLFRGIMDWMGFRRVLIEFKADAREHGEAGYTYSKLWKLAINSLTSFSLWPLRITGYLGVLITLISSILLLWMLVNYIIRSQIVYTPLAIVVVANTLLIGIVLMAIGLVALYVGAIHTEVINRPLYVVRQKVQSSISNYHDL